MIKMGSFTLPAYASPSHAYVNLKTGKLKLQVFGQNRIDTLVPRVILVLNAPSYLYKMHGVPSTYRMTM